MHVSWYYESNKEHTISKSKYYCTSTVSDFIFQSFATSVVIKKSTRLVALTKY